jgi:diguanylate cyclase (GGDEF)-like protein/PAS domain S-box-containing protein
VHYIQGTAFRGLVSGLRNGDDLMAKAGILIVEDEQIIALDIQSSLENNGFQVVGLADRGNRAIYNVEQLKPDLVLMDIVLKDEMDGIQTAVKIRERFNIPIIFLTAYDNHDIIRHARLAEPFGYLLKPFNERELISNIEMALYKHQMECKLRESEERYRVLVETSPDSIGLTDMQGRFLAANQQFLRQHGFSSLEELQASGEKVAFITETDRPRIHENVEELLARGSQNLIETVSYRYDGSSYPVEVNLAAIKDSQGKPESLVFISRDITQRKQSENIIQARLRLVEFAARHSLDELFQKTLDEVCAITDSPIGFYHLVASDQVSLTLQAWSTRTLEEFCTATGKGMHYSIDEAGVWVDCVRQKRPVIHNDYASLPHRKGLPEGHALVVRELVVPILRAEKIVAILGVGNKAQDYTEKDIELVIYFADIALEIAERKQVETELRKLSQAVEQSANVIVVTDAEGVIEYVNPKFLEVTGYSPEEASGKTPRILSSGEHTLTFYENLWQTIKSGKVWHGEFHNRRKDGALYWEDTTITPVFDPDGNLINFIGVKEDITARKLLEEAERDQRQLANALVDTAAALNSTLKLDGVLDCILDNIEKIVTCDMVMIMILEEEELKAIRYRNRSQQDVDHIDLINVHANTINDPMMQSMIHTKQPQIIPDTRADAHCQAYDGMRWIGSYLGAPLVIRGSVVGAIHLVSATPGFFTLEHTGRLKAFASQAAIAIENAQLYEQAQYLSVTDPLTEMNNRRYLFDIGGFEFERIRRYGGTLSAIMIDIDHFKHLNDRHGHAVGDLALREVARRIKSCLRAVDIVARYGGEEFVILMPETHLKEAGLVAERVRRSIGENPIVEDNLAVRTTLSLGVAEVDQSCTNLDELLKCADQALYAAKAAGRNRVAYLHKGD